MASVSDTGFTYQDKLEPIIPFIRTFLKHDPTDRTPQQWPFYRNEYLVRCRKNPDKFIGLEAFLSVMDYEGFVTLLTGTLQHFQGLVTLQGFGSTALQQKIVAFTRALEVLYEGFVETAGKQEEMEERDQMERLMMPLIEEINDLMPILDRLPNLEREVKRVGFNTQ